MDDNPIKILLIEDNPADARLIPELLREAKGFAFDLEPADRLSKGLYRLAEGGIDIVLLDLSLPDSQGFETFARVRDQAPGTPIVVLTGLDDGALGVRAVQQGAQDYLVKGQVDGNLLTRSLRHAIERKWTEERLAQAETLRALGELAGGMAHHVNNLLTVILGRTQLVLPKVKEPEIRRSLAIVEQATLDAAEVVRRVHRFATAQPFSEVGPVDLNRLAHEVLELARAGWQDKAQRRGIQIEASLEPGEIPPVVGQHDSLREVLMNLLLNAIDALPQGGRITVKTWASGQAVHCSVADSGVGMADEIRRRALEPFFTTKGPGTRGLGLSVSYGIIRRHHGKLNVESSPGNGTTVTIRLPHSPADSVATRETATPSIPASPLQILIIDDEVEVRGALAETLTAMGHKVVWTTGGREGLAWLDAGEPVDLVLTDLGMPGMNGWEVARAVKARQPRLRVGLITGWGETEGTPEERKSVDFVITKPFSVEALRKAIARVGNAPDRPTEPRRAVRRHTKPAA